MKDSFVETTILPAAVSLAQAEAPDPSPSKWSAETEMLMKNLVTLGGVHDWGRVATLMGTQFPEQEWTDTECKGRWEGIISGPDSKKPWTEQEELEMIIVHKLCNNKWSSVAGLIKGRSNNSIKNRFYSIFRKVKNKVKRLETGFNSRIELLEIFYMMSLMEVHLVQPFPPIIQKGKRGKDYIYSLLQNLRMEEIESFKNELAKRAGKEESLSKVWKELAAPLESTKFQLPENIRKIIAQDNSFPHDLGGAFPPLPHIEPMSLESPRRGLTLPKWNPSIKPASVTEDEKAFIHAQVFLSKAPQPNPYCKDLISTGTSINHASLLSPGTVAMQSYLPRKCSIDDPYKIQYGDFAYMNRPKLFLQPNSMAMPPSVASQIVQYTPYTFQPMYQQPAPIMLVPKSPLPPEYIPPY